MTTHEEREQEKACYLERGRRRRNIWDDIYRGLDWLKSQECKDLEQKLSELSELVDKNDKKPEGLTPGPNP